MSSDDEEHVVRLQNGSVIQLHSEPQSLASTTGWVTWNASIAVIRYVERIQNCNDSADDCRVHGRRVADLSTGNGLVALALAYLGASSVIATEVPACSSLTRANVVGNQSVQNIVSVVDYCWGDDVCPIQDCDLVIGSDLLFIAIRDSIYEQLRKTICDICTANKKLLFCYEERILDKEQAFITALERDCELDLYAVPDEKVYSNSDTFDIFYEAPSIRMYVISRASSI